MSGEVNARIEVAHDGKISTVVADTRQKLLQLTVDRALSEAKISEGCRGTTVHLSFVFELTNEVRQMDSGTVFFRAPATFLIRASILPVTALLK